MEEKTTVSSTMAKFPKRRRMQNKIVDQAREEITWALSLTDAEVVSLTYDDVSKRLTPQGWKEALKKRKRWKELQWQDLFQEVTLLLPRKKTANATAVPPFDHLSENTCTTSIGLTSRLASSTSVGPGFGVRVTLSHDIRQPDSKIEGSFRKYEIDYFRGRSARRWLVGSLVF
jgi:hypothetical protein